MQTLDVNVGGIGTALDTSKLASGKTITVVGLGAGDSLEVEVSTDGVNFNPAKTFTQGKSVQHLNYPVAAIRTDATNTATGGVTASVDAATSTTQSVVIPTPALNAAGASLDISALSNFSACSVNNLLPAGAEIRFEVANVDADASFVPLHTFDEDDSVVKNISHRFIRAVSVGATGADLSMTVENSTSAGGGSVAEGGTNYTFTFRPGASAGDLVDGRIFDTFKPFYDACRAAYLSGAAPYVYTIFDNSFSGDTDYLGGATCNVPSSSSEPGGVYLVDGWRIEGGEGSLGPAPVNGGSINFLDDAVFSTESEDIRIELWFGHVINESTTSIALRPSSNRGICIDGGPQVRLAVAPGAMPIAAPINSAVSFWYFCMGENGMGGFGDTNGGPSSDPIVDMQGQYTVVTGEGNSIGIADNTFMDSGNDGGGGGGGILDVRGFWRRGRLNTNPGAQPGMGEAGTDVGFRSRIAMNVRLCLENNKFAPGSPATVSNEQLTVGGRFVDTTPIVINDSLTFVDDVGGGNSGISGADFSNIKVGDEVIISSALNKLKATAFADGDGTDLVLDGVVLTNEGPVTSTVTRKDVRLFAPIASSPNLGDLLTIINQGPGNVILLSNPNLRNVGGVAGNIAKNVITPGLGFFTSNAGMDGTNIGGWERLSSDSQAPSNRLSNLSAPDAADATGVHAAYAGNIATAFPGAFTDPDVPRAVRVVYAAAYDGGNTTITGTGQNDELVVEIIVAVAGSTVEGTKVFKTVTSADQAVVGANAATASIGFGLALGLLQVIASSDEALLFADGVGEAGIFDDTENTVVTTTAPNGAVEFKVLANSQ